MAAIELDEIFRVLPHRYPMLLVDRIVECDDKKRIVGLKNLTVNEPFFQGHFPENPIMPGVLQLEAMAQVGGLLLNKITTPLIMGIVFFLVIAPFALVLRVIGKDPLRRSYDQSVSSYRIETDQTNQNDLENPF